jgi:hypothetical protein
VVYHMATGFIPLQEMQFGSILPFVFHHGVSRFTRCVSSCCACVACGALSSDGTRRFFISQIDSF